MATLSLREAAQQTGASKSTIWRAIKSGRMSAARMDDNGFAIDPAELFRVFPKQVETVSPGHDATTSETTDKADDTELRVRLAVAETELRLLRELIDELKVSRDDWRTNANRLLTTNQPKSWWKRLAG